MIGREALGTTVDQVCIKPGGVAETLLDKGTAINEGEAKAMIAIDYFEHDGTQHTVSVDPGVTLMEAAVKNGVPGIDADCGGACACATCHVYIPDAWRAAVGEAGSDELEMLECSSGVQPNSRLSCQIIVTPAFDGLRVDLPASQD